MKWLTKLEIMNAGKTGLFVGVLGMAVVWLLKLVTGVPHVIFAATVPDINVRAQLETGTATNIGDKLLSYLGGVLPTGNLAGGIIAVLLSSIVIYIVGAQALRLITTRNYKPAASIALAGALGSLVTAAVLGPITGLLTLSFLSIFLALLFYYLIIGYALTGLLPLVGMKVPDF